MVNQLIVSRMRLRIKHSQTQVLGVSAVVGALRCGHTLYFAVHWGHLCGLWSIVSMENSLLVLSIDCIGAFMAPLSAGRRRNTAERRAMAPRAQTKCIVVPLPLEILSTAHPAVSWASNAVDLALLKGDGLSDFDWVKGNHSQNTPMTNHCLFYALECGGEGAVCVHYRSQYSKMAMATPSPYDLALSADEQQNRARRTVR